MMKEPKNTVGKTAPDPLNTEEGKSVASDKTVKGKGGYHYNDSDGENSCKGRESDDESESSEEYALVEDDENLVNSNKTSVVNKKNASKVIIPPFTRYQMMIQLEQATNDAAIEEEKEGDDNPLEKIRVFLS